VSGARGPREKRSKKPDKKVLSKGRVPTNEWLSSGKNGGWRGGGVRDLGGKKVHIHPTKGPTGGGARKMAGERTWVKDPPKQKNLGRNARGRSGVTTVAPQVRGGNQKTKP